MKTPEQALVLFERRCRLAGQRLRMVLKELESGHLLPPHLLRREVELMQEALDEEDDDED